MYADKDPRPRFVSQTRRLAVTLHEHTGSLIGSEQPRRPADFEQCTCNCNAKCTERKFLCFQLFLLGDLWNGYEIFVACGTLGASWMKTQDESLIMFRFD